MDSFVILEYFEIPKFKELFHSIKNQNYRTGKKCLNSCATFKVPPSSRAVLLNDVTLVRINV